MVKAPAGDDQGWYGAVGDDNHENGLVSGAIAGREQDQQTPATRHGLFRGSGPDQQAHEQPEIVPGDMDQVALVDVPATTQPRSPHAAALQSVGKRAFDDLGRSEERRVGKECRSRWSPYH